MSPYDALRSRLENGPILLDAPVGAELVRRGVRWRKHGLLTDADAVRQAHVDYLRAGADVLRTNTFGLNKRTYLNVFRSPEHQAQIGAPGLAELHLRLLRTAVEAARAARDEAGRPEVPLFGVMSTLEHVFRPDLAPDDADDEHAEIARTLAEAGVDALAVEAMNTVAETRAAVAAAGGTGRPFVVSFAVDERGELLDGTPLRHAVEVAEQGGADAVVMTAGLPAECARALREARTFTGLPIGFAPICGRFDPPSWKFEFHPRFGESPAPEQFAREVAATGARIVGGWCGAGPEHVAALRAAVGAAAR
jgi:S-methylmethionine-dependent homocysteine/selenocysteine methylase